jgi:hypothetical protein
VLVMAAAKTTRQDWLEASSDGTSLTRLRGILDVFVSRLLGAFGPSSPPLPNGVAEERIPILSKAVIV